MVKDLQKSLLPIVMRILNLTTILLLLKEEKAVSFLDLVASWTILALINGKLRTRNKISAAHIHLEQITYFHREEKLTA